MFNYCSINEIKPKGWLHQQLKIEANGLAGNLDKVWPDIKESAWIGGNREGWERVPYWLDGVIPLAYLLNDTDLIGRVEKYINAIVSRQEADGWICPCSKEARSSYDIWSLFLIGKVFVQYCEITGSKKVEKCLYDAMLCAYREIYQGKIKLFDWGKFRYFEAYISLICLYDKYKEEWIKDFALLLKNQGADYQTMRELWRVPLNKWRLETHIVNIVMMLKYEALFCELFGEKITDIADELWDELFKYNGTVVGSLTGDECLSGIGNNRGTELCSIVELMYSFEILFGITKNVKWLERLEKISFNALPATISDDMWTHQYDQMVNQIECTKFYAKSHFRTNNTEAHLFGLEPNFGCCTSNFAQGWPKLASSVFLKSGRDITISMMLPSELETNVDGVRVTISVDTEYPFNFTSKIKVDVSEEIDFNLNICIPQWLDLCVIKGVEQKDKGIVCIGNKWQGSTVIDVEYFCKPCFEKRPFGLYSATYGPLVYSLPLSTEYSVLEYEKDGVERKFPYCDYELRTNDEWQYAFFGNELIPEKGKGDDVPFSSQNPKSLLKAKCCRIDWEYEDGYDNVSSKVPSDITAKGEAEEKILYPYGCSKLRMTEMPMIKK